MKKNTVKKVFFFFMVFLPLQFAAVGIVGELIREPWPAFVFPAFQSNDARPRYIAVVEPRMAILESEGDIAEVPASSIFTGIPASQLRGFLRNHFADTATWAKKGPEAAAWLHRIVNENHASVNATGVQVLWRKTYFNFSKDNIRVDSSQVMETFTISFKGSYE